MQIITSEDAHGISHEIQVCHVAKVSTWNGSGGLYLQASLINGQDIKLQNESAKNFLSQWRKFTQDI